MELISIEWSWIDWQWAPTLDIYAAMPDGRIFWLQWLGLDLQVKVKVKE